MVQPAPQQSEVGYVRLAQASRGFDDSVENRLEIGWRTTDHFKHIAGGGLILERLLQLALARLLRREQPRVLDGDHGLIGERLQQLDLLACERSRALLVQGDEADLLAIAKERSADDGAKADNLRRLQIWKFGICEHVGNLQRALFQGDTTDQCASARHILMASDKHAPLGLDAVGCGKRIVLTLPAPQNSLFGPAKPRRSFDQSVEHGLQIESRAADDLEHVGGGGLLLQRLAQLIEQPHVLDGDDGLIGKCPQHRKLLVGQRSGHKPHDAEQADRLIAARHGHDRDCAVAAGQEVLAPGGKFRRGIRDVGNIHDPAIEQRCAVHVIPREGGTGNCASPGFDESRIRSGDCRGIDRGPIPERDADEGARKELQPTLHDGVEHRLRVGGRGADYPQDLGGRRLTLVSLVQLSRQLLDRATTILIRTGCRSVRLHVDQLVAG